MPRARQSPRKGHDGPTGPASQFLTAFSTPEDRRAVLARQIEADLAGEGLDLWEDRFCQWLALQPMNNVRRDRQREAASVLAGKEISSQELIALRQRPAWRQRWGELRNFDNAIRAARSNYASIIEDSPRLYKKMLGVAENDSDVRAATPLLVPLLDRAVPRSGDDITVPKSLHISITVEQAKGLEATAHVVEAEEVDFTVVEDS